MKHIDLFSGIGGFALAIDTVWPGSEHMFCDFDPFCQQILKKHWPNSKIYADIRTITNTFSSNGGGKDDEKNEDKEWKTGKDWAEGIQSKDGEAYSSNSKQGNTVTSNTRVTKQRGISDSSREEISAPWNTCDLLTGGFPCQPFSAAGKRKGTEDNRYLWPEMFRIISTFKPTWVIAENVRGLVTWNEGLVLEQVCADLEGQGYEVQPFIIPAVAVNAPHRRDRIWFIANRNSNGLQRAWKQSNSSGQNRLQNRKNFGWEVDWLEVATELCGVDDGLPARMDGFKFTKAGHRTQRLKALGNSIVPQVAIEIMKAIKNS